MAEPVREAPVDILYQPGISFANPMIIRPVTQVRANPWFYEAQVPGPLSATAKLKKWEAKPNLTRYKAVWNRRAKQRNLDGLGAYFHDVPQFHELGEAPATKETQAVTRSSLGFLQNLQNLFTTGTQIATGVTDIISNRETQKQQAALAQIQTFNPFYNPFGATTGSNTMLWVAGAGILGLGALLFLRRK